MSSVGVTVAQLHKPWPKSRRFLELKVNSQSSSASRWVYFNANLCWWIGSREMPGRYISPYNLDERMKRLDRPGLPEKPCICDPECMCADLCADDLTQNCLCEENGLFCLVTEGWDIDDLDVPDLEGVEQSKSVNTRNSDEVKPMLAHDTPPDSPTLHLAFQLATTDRAQLERLKQYSQHIKRPQHKVQTKTSKLQDRSFSVWVTPNSSDAGQNRASQQHQRAVKPLAHSAIERQ